MDVSCENQYKEHMKTNKLYIMMAMLGMLLNSCSLDTVRVSSDDAITYEDVNIIDYSTLEIANDFNAYVSFSDTEEHIQIEANENLHDYITTSKNGDKLRIALKNGVLIKGSKTLNVYITTNSITTFNVIADSNLYLETPLVTNTAKIKIAADSYFSGEVQVSDLELDMTADARADLYGHANHLDAKLSADAKLSDFELDVDHLKIKMTADCHADLTVNKTIDVEAFADCRLRYKGDAQIIRKNLKADSKVIKVN